MNEVKEYFDKIAPEYDSWKKRNWYYYRCLKCLVQEHVPSGKIVLEIGTGTGDILACLKPKQGVGLDISERMVELARTKYKDCSNLRFFSKPLEELKNDTFFDFIILVDVVEHIENIPLMIKQIMSLMNTRNKVFISLVNTLWKPILQALEGLRLKMPEGKHYRISAMQLVSLFRAGGFELEERGFAILIPMHIPLLSNFVNRWFLKIPFLRQMGLLEFLIFSKKGNQAEELKGVKCHH